MKRLLLLSVICLFGINAAEDSCEVVGAEQTAYLKEVAHFEALFQTYFKQLDQLGASKDRRVKAMALESEDVMYVVTRIDGVANKSSKERAELLAKKKSVAKKWLKKSQQVSGSVAKGVPSSQVKFSE